MTNKQNNGIFIGKNIHLIIIYWNTNELACSGWLLFVCEKRMCFWNKSSAVMVSYSSEWIWWLIKIDAALLSYIFKSHPDHICSRGNNWCLYNVHHAEYILLKMISAKSRSSARRMFNSEPGERIWNVQRYVNPYPTAILMTSFRGNQKKVIESILACICDISHCKRNVRPKEK